MSRMRRANDLRTRYPLHLEIGMICSLSVILIAFNLDFRPGEQVLLRAADPEVVPLEVLPPSRHPDRPPPPPRPLVPLEVPNETELPDDPISFDALDDWSAPLEIPDRPPEPKEPERTEPVDDFFVVVEEMPELIGGIASIHQRIIYPEMARKAGLEGRVYVQFVVNEQGDVVDVYVVRGLGGGIDEEAIRAISLAKFKPGRQRGQPVRVRMTMSINFKLQ